MKKRLSILIVLFLVTGALLVACGSRTEEQLPAPEEDQTAQEVPAEEPGEADTGVEAAEGYLPDDGMDLSGVNVCQLLDPAAVAAVVGEEIDADPQEMLSIDREKGCRFDGVSGNYYEITLHPLDQWGLTEYILNEPQELPGVGDGAFSGSSSDAALIRVLAAGRVVIEVRVSDEDPDHALGLYELALQSLP